MTPASRVLPMLLAFSTAVPAEPLGRLFFTPEQRAALDDRRARDSRAKSQPQRLSVDGVVIGPGGRATVWINRRPQHDSAAQRAVHATPAAHDPGRVTLAMGGERRSLRVGESLDRRVGPTPPLPSARP